MPRRVRTPRGARIRWSSYDALSAHPAECEVVVEAGIVVVERVVAVTHARSVVATPAVAGGAHAHPDAHAERGAGLAKGRADGREDELRRTARRDGARRQRVALAARVDGVAVLA